MRVAYSEWDSALEGFIRSMENLRRLFYQLILRTNGDVEEAIEWMRHLQERGMIPEDWDVDAFLEQLERENLVSGDGGTLHLTKKGSAPSVASRWS